MPDVSDVRQFRDRTGCCAAAAHTSNASSGSGPQRPRRELRGEPEGEGGSPTWLFAADAARRHHGESGRDAGAVGENGLARRPSKPMARRLSVERPGGRHRDLRDLDPRLCMHASRLPELATTRRASLTTSRTRAGGCCSTIGRHRAPAVDVGLDELIGAISRRLRHRSGEAQPVLSRRATVAAHRRRARSPVRRRSSSWTSRRRARSARRAAPSREAAARSPGGRRRWWHLLPSPVRSPTTGADAAGHRRDRSHEARAARRTRGSTSGRRAEPEPAADAHAAIQPRDRVFLVLRARRARGDAAHFSPGDQYRPRRFRSAPDPSWAGPAAQPNRGATGAAATHHRDRSARASHRRRQRQRRAQTIAFAGDRTPSATRKREDVGHWIDAALAPERALSIRRRRIRAQPGMPVFRRHLAETTGSSTDFVLYVGNDIEDGPNQRKELRRTRRLSPSRLRPTEERRTGNSRFASRSRGGRFFRTQLPRALRV
jgi:hypothetical protein